MNFTNYSGSHSEPTTVPASTVIEPSKFEGLLLDQYLESLHSQPTFNPELDSL